MEKAGFSSPKLFIFLFFYLIFWYFPWIYERAETVWTSWLRGQFGFIFSLENVFLLPAQTSRNNNIFGGDDEPLLLPSEHCQTRLARCEMWSLTAQKRHCPVRQTTSDCCKIVCMMLAWGSYSPSVVLTLMWKSNTFHLLWLSSLTKQRWTIWTHHPHWTRQAPYTHPWEKRSSLFLSSSYSS